MNSRRRTLFAFPVAAMVLLTFSFVGAAEKARAVTTLMNSRRRTLFAFAVAAMVLLTFSSAGAAEKARAVATLKPLVTVEGGYISIGDIFSGAGENADKVIIHAPQPGRRIVLEANWLYRVARAYGINWRPMSQSDHTVVERTSHVIDSEQISEALLAAVNEREGSMRPIEVVLDNRLQKILLPTTVHPAVTVQSLVVDPHTNRFNATISAGADSPEAVRVAVAGHLYELIEVPVAARRLKRGEVIAEDDLEWMLVRTESVSRNVLADPNDIVGMSARRSLQPHTPLSSSDIEKPTLVTKGNLVTITLRTPSMLLTAKGKALDSGAMGETIRVRNTKSKLVIDATVNGHDTVVAAYQNY